MTMADEPLTRIDGAGKLRNGIYLRSVALYSDRIAFEVFASRPFSPIELDSFRLTDNFDTPYEMLPLAQETLDGQGQIEFAPAVPPGWTRLHLAEPGWGLHILLQPQLIAGDA